MIPVQLTLKNFLSYREATLDFRGLHTACISGANGAGKSSLLEAITWAIWGESRAATEDDVIQTGAKEVRVDFIFQANQQNYRVIRTRIRGGASVLEFQVSTPSGFRPLTGKGVRVTQDLILEHIKLDYDTFINSAYLRQGRADEFMLKRPSERKEILAELLKLNQYDELSERAKDLSRQFKARVEEISRSLESIKKQLQQREAIAQQKSSLEVEHNQLQQQQAFDSIQLQSLQVVQHQRQTWEQQLGFVRQQHQNLSQDCDRLQQELGSSKGQLASLGKILNQEAEIVAGFTQYQSLLAQEETMGADGNEYNRAQQLRATKQQQLTKQINEIERQAQQVSAQIEALEQQESEIQQTLGKSGEVEAAMAQLLAARNRLKEMDELQLKISPLLQERINLQNQLARSHASLVARLEQLQTSSNQLQQLARRQPELQQAVVSVRMQIEQLEKDRVYLQRVQEKGQERRHFIERLQAHQRDFERLLAELEQKLLLLQTPNAICPLCERPLDEHHWNRVVDKTKEEFKDNQDQLWVVREQMAVSDKEIQVLRQEYRQIAQKLSAYDALREQRGQLAAQIESSNDATEQLSQIAIEKEKLERSLQQGDWAPEKQLLLQQLEENLQKLNYSEHDHALARSEVERWRWAEIRQGQIKDATKRLTQINIRKPELKALLAELHVKIEQERTNSELALSIAALSRRIEEIGYDPQKHDELRGSIRLAQGAQFKYQQLQQAQQQYPQLQKRTTDLESALQNRLTSLQAIAAQVENINQQLAQTSNPSGEIQSLEESLAFRRQKLDEQIASLGRLSQSAQHLENLQEQYEQEQEELKQARQEYLVYQELAQAFGKNGIQTLMIENVLPQLEAETNQLLSRLSANQLHVQFVTQRTGRGGRASKKNAKLIDTLDILIADARGTRAYETYSGGEAFRINFAIRLALAKLLAQRAGAALQMLIVDEGFGTQDNEGCERLIAAINAIAPEFACILTVTHMPHLKEAFQARIEVNKNQQGSQIRLLM